MTPEERRQRQRLIRKLLALAGGDPLTLDPERRAAHLKAEQLAGGTRLWVDTRAVERLRSILR